MQILSERYHSLLSMMRFLNKRKDMLHSYEEVMEGMVKIDWISDGKNIVYPVILRISDKCYELGSLTEIPYYCKLNNYGY